MATSEKQYEWLIIFLAYNNNYYDMEHQDTSDYYTMKEQTKYIRNQIRYSNHNANIKTVLVEAKIDNCGKAPVATLSILQKKHDRWLSAVNNIWREADNLDIFTTDISLQKVLQQLKDDFKANKHMLITVGHGSIVGINYYIPDLKVPASRKNAPKLENLFDKKQFFNDDEIASPAIGDQRPKHVTEKEKKLLFLNNHEISEAIKNVFTRLDVLVMYNCIMQNIFSQYDFKDCTEWFVAPLSGISIPGYNYKDVLNEISKNSSTITSEAVAKLFIDTIRTGNKYEKFKTDIEGTWKFTATKINSGVQEEISKKFDSLFVTINEIKSDKLLGCLYETARFSFNYSNYCLSTIRIVDIGVFLAFLKDKITREYKSLNSLLSYIDELQASVQLLKKDSHVFQGNDFYKKDGEINYVEHKEKFKDKIVNVGLFIPITDFKSDVLDDIYVTGNDNQETGTINEDMPRFLKKDHYGSILNQLRKLPN